MDFKNFLMGRSMLRCPPTTVIGLVVLSFGMLNAESTFEKDSAYFYDRYGSPKMSKNVKRQMVVSPFGVGADHLEAPYIYRQYKRDNLRVEVLFRDPSLKATYVTLTLPNYWTDEQRDSALNSYGSGWRKLFPQDLTGVTMNATGLRSSWISQEGAIAFYQKIFKKLIFYSPDTIESFQANLEKKKANKKMVPQF